MKEIILKNCLPNVFASCNHIESEIWNKEMSFERGKSYLLEAVSGTGKTSLCSYITGARNDYRGAIYFDTYNIAQYRVKDWVNIRKNSLSHLFQELRLFPELTAWENVQLKNSLTNYKDESEILRWFEQLGIADKVHAKVGVMSFGQQQRVAIMRTLVQPFDFLLADEPISHLDDLNSNLIGTLVQEEIQKQGAGLIVTSIGKHIDMHYDKIYRL